MENSVDATIEKIKLQEQIKEAKLIEKREYPMTNLQLRPCFLLLIENVALVVVDLTVATLSRSIRDTKTKADKIKQDIIQIQCVAENLQDQINALKYQKNALTNQVDKCFQELNQLRTESERKIASVWKLRADLSETMKHVAESCDLRTLLIKSTGIHSAGTLNTRNQQSSENILINRKKMQNALERRENSINKRRNLLDKPEKDDEFIRIKEALRYSEQMVANLKAQENV